MGPNRPSFFGASMRERFSRECRVKGGLVFVEADYSEPTVEPAVAVPGDPSSGYVLDIGLVLNGPVEDRRAHALSLVDAVDHLNERIFMRVSDRSDRRRDLLECEVLG